MNPTQAPSPTIEHVAATSAPLDAAALDQLRALFPQVFVEGKIDFDRLRTLLGDTVETAKERYSFTWAGKSDAIRLLQTPTSATLVPDKPGSVNWDSTENLFIEGDNLEVLKLLYKAYFGRVKMIYIDPPYNTGNDFIYPDNFRDPLAPYLQLTGQADAQGNLVTSNPDTSGRYHSAWLNMMYPRLFVARQLLCSTGVIFVSVDDHELANLQILMNEIFGEENFKADIAWQKRYTRSNNTVDFTTMVEHILVYAKGSEFAVNLLPRTEDADARYSNPDNDPRGPWKGASFLNPASPEQRPNLAYPLRNPNTGKVTNPTTNAWRRSQQEFERLQRENRLYWGLDGRQPVPSIKMYLSEARDLTPVNFWPHDYAGNTDDGSRDLAGLIPEKVFDNPKPVQLLKRVLEHGSLADSIVMDFFTGAGTFAQAVTELNVEDGGNRRYIVVQLPEPLDANNRDQQAAASFCDAVGKPRTIAEISKERIRRAANRLKHAPPQLAVAASASQLDLGFRVFKLAPSHLKAWAGTAAPTPEAYLRQLDAFADPFATGSFDPDAVVWEVAIKEGYSLTSQIETANVAGQVVNRVTDPARGESFHVCLDDAVGLDVVARLQLTSADLFVCRDSALDDTTAANLALQCRLKLI